MRCSTLYPKIKSSKIKSSARPYLQWLRILITPIRWFQITPKCDTYCDTVFCDSFIVCQYSNVIMGDIVYNSLLLLWVISIFVCFLLLIKNLLFLNQNRYASRFAAHPAARKIKIFRFFFAAAEQGQRDRAREGEAKWERGREVGTKVPLATH